MRRITKMAVLIASAVVTAGALAGCSGSSETAQTKAQAETKADSEKAGSEEASDDTSWPDSTVSIVVGASAGGGTDLLARVFADQLTQKLGQSFVVVNVTGAGGSNATNQVYDAEPDGNTICFYHNAMIVNSVTNVTDYSFEDFVPGPHVVTDAATGLYVSAKAEYKTYPELIEYCKAHPGEVTVGVESAGYTYYMVKSFEKATGVQFKYVDVGSNADKMTALLGGHIDVVPCQYSTAKGYIESGDFVALGFPTEERSEIFPDVPTAKEQGVDWLYNGYEFGFWLTPGTDPAIAAKLDTAVKELMEDPAVQEKIRSIGNEPTYLSPEEYKDMFAKITEEYKQY